MNFTELQQRVHQTAVSKGWHERPLLVDGKPDPDRVLRSHALIHSELTEAVDCWLAHDIELRLADNGKPEGFLTELADVVIRIADTTAALGLPLRISSQLLALPDDSERSSIETVRALVDRATECVRVDDWETYALLLASAVEHVRAIASRTSRDRGARLDEVIAAKARYNESRPHRHGGKTA